MGVRKLTGNEFGLCRIHRIFFPFSNPAEDFSTCQLYEMSYLRSLLTYLRKPAHFIVEEEFRSACTISEISLLEELQDILTNKLRSCIFYVCVADMLWNFASSSDPGKMSVRLALVLKMHVARPMFCMFFCSQHSRTFFSTCAFGGCFTDCIHSKSNNNFHHNL